MTATPEIPDSLWIQLQSIRLFGHHGVTEEEQKIGQVYEVSIRLHTRCGEAMLHDQLDDTINYAQVYEIVKQKMSVPSKLLENVAWRIANELLKTFSCRLLGGSVSIGKLSPPIPGCQLQAATVTLNF